MDIFMSVWNELRSGNRTGIEIIRALHTKCFAKDSDVDWSADDVVCALNSYGFWAEALPFEKGSCAIHVTDRAISERDPSTLLLSHFGARALPYFCWPNSRPVYAYEHEQRDRFNPPAIADEEKGWLREGLTDLDERREKFKGSLAWLTTIGAVNEEFRMLIDLSQKNTIAITFTEDPGDLNIIGFDKKGLLRLNSIEQTFCYDCRRRALSIGTKKIWLIERATYQEGNFICGTITIGYIP